MSKVWRRIWMVIGIVVIILLITNQFTSNPYEKHRAAIKLETYLNKKYPEQSFLIEDGKFDRKKELYQFKVTNKNNLEESYHFKIENGSNYRIVKDHMKNDQIDEEESQRLSLEASNAIKLLLENDLPTVKSVTAAIKVPKKEDGDQFPAWTPTFNEGAKESAAKLLMDIDVSGMTKNDMYLLSTEVYKILGEENVNYSSATLTGYKTKGKTGNKKWNYQYKMEFTKKEQPRQDKVVVIS